MQDFKDLLSEENCRRIVENCSGENKISILEYEIKPLDNNLDGLIGEQYTVNIKFEHSGKQDEVQAFFKILNGNSHTMFELSKEIKAFEREDFFYNTLVPEFTKYGIDMSFIPKCYLCVPYTVVLENLCLQRYKCYEKLNNLNLEGCQCALDTLAKFHASSIVYEKKRSSELTKPFTLLQAYPDLLQELLFSKKDNVANRWLRCSIQGLLEVIDLIPDFGVSKDDFRITLAREIDKIMEKNYSKLQCCILHGDLWSNNFLYKCDKESPMDAKLIDFQVVKYGPVALDVEQFIMTNTRKIFRDNHEGELLEHYFNSFSGIIKRHGYVPDEILSRDDFITSCRTMKFAAKVQAIADRSLTYMSEEVFVEVMRDDERFRKFLFSDRGKYIVESYTKNDQFRELIHEDMLELRDLLPRD